MTTQVSVKIPFPSIVGFKKDKMILEDLFKGSFITISEKIDGSNLQIERIGNKLVAGSKSVYLTEDFTLRGALQAVQSLPVENFEEGFVYFGEWIKSRNLDYGEHVGTIRLFNVAENELVNGETKFVNYNKMVELVNKTGLELAPYFYVGEFISTEHILNFIGKTVMVNENAQNKRTHGEGVVVNFYNNETKELLVRADHKPFMTKFVHSDFTEYLQKAKRFTVNSNAIEDFAERTILPARITKVLHKLMDTNEIPEEFTKKDFGTIVPLLKSKVWEDVLKEEKEEFDTILSVELPKAILKAEEDGYDIAKEKLEESLKNLVNSTLSKRVVKILTENISVK